MRTESQKSDEPLKFKKKLIEASNAHSFLPTDALMINFSRSFAGEYDYDCGEDEEGCEDDYDDYEYEDEEEDDDKKKKKKKKDGDDDDDDEYDDEYEVLLNLLQLNDMP